MTIPKNKLAVSDREFKLRLASEALRNAESEQVRARQQMHRATTAYLDALEVYNLVKQEYDFMRPE